MSVGAVFVRQVAFEEKNDWVYLLAVKENEI